MPASFVRLRIAGFKSFAEPTVVDLLPGLTGVVGPNGCGKSNVVEALRWAMGENSARSLRGGEMDDVIFAGTAHRPRRDIAEVTLWLADTEGLAPPPFQREPELQISRRIERESGSIYRVNGREARARDVQTLFADLATGARSSAMVSQGRVAAVVGASPAERRTILEEAAGITGLHARRHEAELKLRATEANLARAEDLAGQLTTQLDGLRKQAKQAARFRTIGDAIGEAERDLLAIQQAAAQQALQAAEADLAVAEQAVVTGAAAAIATQGQAASIAAALPDRRGAEATTRTALERARIEAEQAGAEAADAERALDAARQRVAQVSSDLAHAESLQTDAAAAADRLEGVAVRTAEEDAAHPALLVAAQTEAEAATSALAEAEAGAEAATERSADLLARHRAATEANGVAEGRARQTAARAAQLVDEVARARSQMVPPQRLLEAEAARDQAATTLRSAAAALESAEASRPATQEAVAASRSEAASSEAARARLAAAAQGVAEALAASAGAGWKRVVDELDVPLGLEAGIAARLAAVMDTGWVHAERDGVTQRDRSVFGVIALDEGIDEAPPGALTDRLAFQVPSQGAAADPVDADIIDAARERLAGVAPGPETIEALVAACAQLGIASLRAPLLALRAACASAALAGRGVVADEDLQLAARLVLAPRATMIPGDPEPPPPPPEHQPEQQEEKQSGRLADTVLEAARAVLPADLLARLARGASQRARAGGASGAIRKNAQRGRTVGVKLGEPKGGARLHLLATLRAAAPWQKARGAGGGRIAVRRGDFRLRRFRQATRTTTIFVVDASGSAAVHRLAEAKGAVELLLAECYVRRDRVALLSVRGAGAEILLPPTSSLARAKRSLAGLPGGGGTPLAAGFVAALALADGVKRGGQTPVAVFMTDGRPNIALDGAQGRPGAEKDALMAARAWRVAGHAALLVDMSVRLHPFARSLADAAAATYLPLPNAGSGLLRDAVRVAVEG